MNIKKDMLKTKNILITLGIAGALTLGGLTADKSTPVLGWEKPQNDSEWAEDVKKENFDIKSTGKLQEMITSHTEKLAREEKEFVKYRDCPDCIRYEFREQLSTMLSGEELEVEVEKQTQEAIKQRAWSVEKLKQSLERMNKEIELRQKGFVVVEGEVSEPVFGATINPKYIRHIND